MKTNIFNTTEFNPSLTHKFFLDSNIWIYLLFPNQTNLNQKLIAIYSDFFDQILRKGCLIETTLLQISEVVNFLQREDYKAYKRDNKIDIPFKEYIKSEAGIDCLKNSKILINSITKSCTLRSGNLSEHDMLELVKQIDSADFNDICFVAHCNKENAIFVTHDFDMKALKYPITLVTSNSKYFSK